MTKYTINSTQLAAISGKNTPNNTQVADILNQYGDNYFITDSLNNLSQFIGQTIFESNGFTQLTENLNYSAKRLTQVWPNRFPTIASAQPYANNPQKLANKVYNGRMGNTGPNDGWLYSGHGLKQLTGKENYTNFNKWMQSQVPGCPNFVKNPQLVAQFPWAVWSAIWFWYTKKIYRVSDDTRKSTYIINGGYNGLDNRIVYVNKAKQTFGSQEESVKVKKPAEQPDELLLQYQEKLNKISKYRNETKFSVGKADGWHGPKTEKAIKAFQKDAGITVDGILGVQTRQAIDTTLDRLETALNTPVAALMTQPVVQTEEVAVTPDIPQELEHKPITKSKTLWTSVLGFFSSIWAFFQMGIDKFTSLPDSVQIAIIGLIALLVILIFLLIKDNLKSKESVQKLKDNIKDVVDSIQN